MSLQDYISNDRLDIYLSHLKVRPDQVMMACHWNKSLSGALLPAMQCLEVTLRNALDLCIQSNPPPAAKGLYETNQNWIFTLPRYMGNRAWPKHSVRRKHYDDMLTMIGWMSPERVKNFTRHHPYHDFCALCSPDGFNRFSRNATNLPPSAFPGSRHRPRAG